MVRRATAKADPESSVDSNVQTYLSSTDPNSQMTESVGLRSPFTQSNDYPTPKSEENSQTSQAYKFPTAAAETLQNISNEPRKLLAAINSIAELGIKSDVLDLPKIVVIGDQSAGKSSAIAAISGISVPRKAGVCTRCPTHIILHEDENSRCVVSLEKHYVLDNDNWEPTQRASTTHFSEVSNSDDLQDVLARAQAAILNPQLDPKTFVSCSPNDSHPDEPPLTEFSPNLIRVEISGPNCPELTFYDLPGVFNYTAKDDHEHLPALVKSLVRDYIKPENHLILLACSMEGDIENSTAGSLIKEVPGAKNRCIGLLTKPDRLPLGNPIEPWRAIFNGESYRLGHEYYVTKQPSQTDLAAGISVSEAREAEVKFFQQNEPWAIPPLSEFSDRFGISNVQAKLSGTLVACIQNSIPALMTKVQKRLAGIKSELSKLPPPPANAYGTVLGLTYKIDQRIAEILEGDLQHLEFMLKWKRVYQKFSDDMFSCRPTLVIITSQERESLYLAKAQSTKDSNSQNPISIPDDDDEQQEDDDDDDMNNGRVNNPLTPSKNRSHAGTKRSGGILTPSPKKRAREMKSPSQSSSATESPNKYTLEALYGIISDNTTSAMGLADHRAEEHIIRQTLEAWDGPLDNFITSSKEELVRAVRSVVDVELAGWKGTQLYKETHELVAEWINKTMTDVHKFGERLITAEKLKPMTVNVESKKQQDDKETKMLQDHRRTYRARLAFEESLVKNRKCLPTQEKEQRFLQAKEKLEKELDADSWQREIEIMGRVRGYYTLASANFIDMVCKIMRLDLFKRCQDEMINSVQVEFKVRDCSTDEGSKRCERLLEEDPKRAKRRQELLREKERFEKAMESLQEVCG